MGWWGSSNSTCSFPPQFSPGFFQTASIAVCLCDIRIFAVFGYSGTYFEMPRIRRTTKCLYCLTKHVPGTDCPEDVSVEALSNRIKELEEKLARKEESALSSDEEVIPRPAGKKSVGQVPWAHKMISRPPFGKDPHQRTTSLSLN